MSIEKTSLSVGACGDAEEIARAYLDARSAPKKKDERWLLTRVATARYGRHGVDAVEG
jgi:hypothetical protein